MERVLSSPLINLINETISGLSTIRAYKFEDIYMENLKRKWMKYSSV